MLALTRKINQELMIGDNIQIKLIKIKHTAILILVNTLKGGRIIEKKYKIKIQQTIELEQGIKIILIKTCGKRASIGIDAPTNKIILRQELYVSKKRYDMLNQYNPFISTSDYLLA